MNMPSAPFPFEIGNRTEPTPPTAMNGWHDRIPKFWSGKADVQRDISNCEQFLGNFAEREIQALPTKPATAWWCSLALPRARSIVFDFGAHAEARSTLREVIIPLTLGHAQQPGIYPRLTERAHICPSLLV